MINIQDFIRSNNLFRKFEVDNLLFVELKCPIEKEEVSNNLWWHNNFFAYAFAGEMALKTLKDEYRFKTGDCIFAKKGSIISARHIIQEDFCEVRIFVPDDFIRSVFRKYRVTLLKATANKETDALIPLAADDVIEAYFHSLLVYFRQPEPPPEILLKLKFEELLVNIFLNNTQVALKAFLNEICVSTRPSVKEIMEANFFSNLSLDEFARLCARSLSTFKEEFKNIFQTSPSKWLQEKRLEYSHYLLQTTSFSVDEICTISGFENRSHFIRVFKMKYGITPGKYGIQARV